MLAIPRMARNVRPTRVVRAKVWAVRTYARAMLKHPGRALSFVLFDPELDNYTYALENLDELGEFLARLFGWPRDAVDAAIHELEDDDTLRAALNTRLCARPDRKPVALYGRRAGWYVMARLLRPQVIVETGVHDGLGSTVFLQALHRNRLDGHPGQLYGIDINPQAGWLIPDHLRDQFTLVVEDSATALATIGYDSPVDLFIHDSDHRYAHEMNEFDLIAPSLSPQAVVLSDNSHATTTLSDFSASHGRSYAFWKERPKDHFYPGAGIGVSLPGGE